MENLKESGSLEPSLLYHCWQRAGSRYYSIWRTGLWWFERDSSKILRKASTWRSLLETRLWTLKLRKEVHRVMEKAFLCLRCFETWKMLRCSQSILVSPVKFSFECRKTKTKSITYRLDYSTSLEAEWNQNQSYCLISVDTQLKTVLQ